MSLIVVLFKIKTNLLKYNIDILILSNNPNSSARATIFLEFLISKRQDFNHIFLFQILQNKKFFWFFFSQKNIEPSHNHITFLEFYSEQTILYDVL